MSSEQNPSPFIELGEHKEFYRFGQSSFSTGTSYAPEWDKNYFVISKSTWVNDETGLPKQVKRGVFLTIPAARALLPKIQAAVEEAESYESKRISSKRKAQPKRADDGHIADFLNQCGVRSAQSSGGSFSGAANSVGSSAERTGAGERGVASQPQLDGAADTAIAVDVSASSASAAAPKFEELEGKQIKPRASRKQPKPEKSSTTTRRPGRPRKIRKSDAVTGDIDERESSDEDGNDSDTRMQ